MDKVQPEGRQYDPAADWHSHAARAVNRKLGKSEEIGLLQPSMPQGPHALLAFILGVHA